MRMVLYRTLSVSVTALTKLPQRGSYGDPYGCRQTVMVKRNCTVTGGVCCDSRGGGWRGETNEASRSPTARGSFR